MKHKNGVVLRSAQGLGVCLLALSGWGCSLWADSQANTFVGGSQADASAEVAPDDAADADAVAMDSGGDTHVDCGPDMMNATTCPSAAPHCYRHACVSLRCANNDDSMCTAQPALAGFQCINNTCTDCDWDDDGSPHRNGDVANQTVFSDSCRVPFGVRSDCNDRDVTSAPSNGRCDGWAAVGSVAPINPVQLAVRVNGTTGYDAYVLGAGGQVQRFQIATPATGPQSISAGLGFGQALAIGASERPGVLIARSVPNGRNDGQLLQIAVRESPTSERLLSSETDNATSFGTSYQGLSAIGSIPRSGTTTPLVWVYQNHSPTIHEATLFGVNPSTPTELSLWTRASTNPPADAPRLVVPPAPQATHVFYETRDAVGTRLGAIQIPSAPGTQTYPSIVPLGGFSGPDPSIRLGSHAVASTVIGPNSRYLVAYIANQSTPTLAMLECMVTGPTCSLAWQPATQTQPARQILPVAISTGNAGRCSDIDLLPGDATSAATVYIACGDQIIRAPVTIVDGVPSVPTSALATVIKSGELAQAPAFTASPMNVTISSLYVVGTADQHGVALVATNQYVSNLFFVSFSH